MTEQDNLNYEEQKKMIFVSGRDFGRLESTVNEINADVKEIKKDMVWIDRRVTTVETSQAVLQAFHNDKAQKKEIAVQEQAGRQLSWQTVAMYITVVVAIVVAISGWMAWGLR